MPRFTISQHTGSKEGDHFDFFLEEGETLKTWRLQNYVFDAPQTARQIKDHRKTYLEYEGEVTGERGRVKVFDTGSYTIDIWSEKLIQVAIIGRQLKTRLRLEKSEDDPEKEPRWTVSDGTATIKKRVAAHLRSASLESAPSPELEPFHSALLEEEHRLLVLVGQYTKGGEIAWSGVEPDKELRDRLHAEWVRWRHPWLEQAREFAKNLDDLVETLRSSRPAIPKT